MGSSLLHGVGLKDHLVVRNLEEYESLFTGLLSDGSRRGKVTSSLVQMRQRLARGVLRGHLYDVDGWTADFEVATALMWDAYFTGGKHYHVSAVRPQGFSL